MINLTRYFFGSLFVDLGICFMTDCFQLLGQLSDLSCGLIWLSGSKIIISYFTAIPHCGWQRWPFENHTCETKATSRLGEDLPEILQADSTCMQEAKTVFFYYSQLTQWMHMPKISIPRYNKYLHPPCTFISQLYPLAPLVLTLTQIPLLFPHGPSTDTCMTSLAHPHVLLIPETSPATASKSEWRKTCYLSKSLP